MKKKMLLLWVVLSIKDLKGIQFSVDVVREIKNELISVALAAQLQNNPIQKVYLDLHEELESPDILFNIVPSRVVAAQAWYEYFAIISSQIASDSIYNKYLHDGIATVRLFGQRWNHYMRSATIRLREICVEQATQWGINCPDDGSPEKFLALNTHFNMDIHADQLKALVLIRLFYMQRFQDESLYAHREFLQRNNSMRSHNIRNAHDRKGVVRRFQ